MITIKEAKRGISFDGLLDENATYDQKALTIFKDEVINLFESVSVGNIPLNIRKVHYKKKCSIHHLHYVYHLQLENRNPIFLKVGIQCDYQHWNHSFSISSFINQIIKNDVEDNFSGSDRHINEIISKLFTLTNETRIKDLSNLISYIDDVALKSYNDLSGENLESQLHMFFSFPPQIKTSCIQYLQYFAQFLMDIGIEAVTEITDKSGETLFKVIPENKEEALDKIKEALDIYLNAPEFEKFEEKLQSNTDVAVVQWGANVHHLKTQLALSLTTPGVEGTPVNALTTTIQYLALSNFILQEKVKTNEEKESEKVTFLGGTIALTKYKGKGFEINLPEIFKRLRRRLGSWKRV